MKLLNFKLHDEIRVGIQTNQGVLDLVEEARLRSLDIPLTMEAVISGGDGVLSKLRGIAETAQNFINEKTIQYAPVVTQPEKILCVGLNYISHAEESKLEIPTTPVLFNKFNSSLAGHKETVFLPEGAKKFDYEAELVIVMGKSARNVSEEEALSYVFGYTVGNDVSARDLQFRTGQWLLGKALDGFAPVGPYIVTADEVGEPTNLNIECRINGALRQSANTRDMIFRCAAIVSYISRYMTLKPGDLIFSGTPEGVIMGYPEDQQVWLKPGDEMEISIGKIGTLTNVLGKKEV